jgi:hypothetical protein
LAQKGIVRLEVQVHQVDVPLLRGIVRALADPGREVATRAWLRARFGPVPAADRKVLLVAAPLEGIDLERPGDLGRAVEL